jgi:hypothetical protein
MWPPRLRHLFLRLRYGVDARVCNRAGYHYGVEFLAVDNGQRQSMDPLRMHLTSFATLS